MVDSALKRLAQMRNSSGSWFIAALEGAQASEGPQRLDPGWFHPSGLSDECDAKLAFEYLGAVGIRKISPSTQRIFDNGSGRDLWLKADTKRAGISLINSEEDRKIEIPRLRIRGELDEWVQNPITGKRYVVDFKTMRSELWKTLDKVVPGHHIQIHPYMYAKVTGHGYVLYENKDTQELKCMEANYDSNIWLDIERRIERILDGLDHDRVYRTPTSCNGCPFFNSGICAANQIARLKEESGLYG